jgi:hypothetical protein
MIYLSRRPGRMGKPTNRLEDSACFFPGDIDDGKVVSLPELPGLMANGYPLESY